MAKKSMPKSTAKKKTLAKKKAGGVKKTTAGPPEPEMKTETKTETEAEANTETEAIVQPEAEKPRPGEMAEKKAPEPEKEVPSPKPPPSEKGFGGPPVPPPPPPSGEPPAQPPSRALMFLIGGLAVVFGVLLIASGMNTGRYYLKQTRKGLEVRQGTFSPAGRKLLMTVPDAKVPETGKKVYSQKEAFGPIFHCYMQQASRRSRGTGMPDLEDIGKTLKTARSYATTPAQKREVDARLSRMEYMSLIFKAETAANEKTLDGYDRALSYLNKAVSLKTIEASEKTLADQKRARIKDERAALEAKNKAARKAADRPNPTAPRP